MLVLYRENWVSNPANTMLSVPSIPKFWMVAKIWEEGGYFMLYFTVIVLLIN